MARLFHTFYVNGNLSQYGPRLVDPPQLQSERGLFDPPPPYASYERGTTTRSASPNPPSEEQRLHQEQQFQLGLELDASKPYYQYEQHVNDEETRIFEADLNGTFSLPVGTDPNTFAQEIVRARWKEQGIWRSQWDSFASGRWKHEEPLELSESDTDSQTNQSSPPLLFCPPRLPRNVDEQHRIAKRQATREREASRPYPQFVYQVSTERERIQDEDIVEGGSNGSIPDINTTAYKNVKNTWIRRRIWNDNWGTLPGMKWKHEEHLMAEATNSRALLEGHVENSIHEAQDSRQHIFEIFGSPFPTTQTLTEPNHNSLFGGGTSPLPGGRTTSLFGGEASPQAGGRTTSLFCGEASPQAGGRTTSLFTDTNSPQQRRLPVIRENGDSYGPSILESPRSRATGRRVPPPKAKRISRPVKLTPPIEEGHQSASGAAHLGLFSPFKVSKPAAKSKARKRRRNPPEYLSSGTSPPLPELDTPLSQTSPNQATQRKNRRARHAPMVRKDSVEKASTSPLKRPTRSKSARGTTSNPISKSPAKPQGVTKRKPAKSRRGKGRK
jgi:hypothetical protein